MTDRPSLDEIARMPARDRLPPLARMIAEAEEARALRDRTMVELRRANPSSALTLEQIAALAGVSLPTAKNVLRGVKAGSGTPPTGSDWP